jgi:hypothetical protein
MEPNNEDNYSVLAVYPSHRGFGFAVLNSAVGLIDWGVARLTPNDDTEFVNRLQELGVRYRPSCVATENIAETARRSRVRQRNQLAVTWALAHGVPTFPVSRANIREFFGSTSNHYDVVIEIARWVPELERHIPRRRRPWESVDERMYLFAAVALAVLAMNEFVVET